MPQPSDPLARVRRAARSKRRAEEEYRASLLAAFDALTSGGASDAYAQLADAAGVTRQTARVAVARALQARQQSQP